VRVDFAVGENSPLPPLRKINHSNKGAAFSWTSWAVPFLSPFFLTPCEAQEVGDRSAEAVERRWSTERLFTVLFSRRQRRVGSVERGQSVHTERSAAHRFSGAFPLSFLCLSTPSPHSEPWRRLALFSPRTRQTRRLARGVDSTRLEASGKRTKSGIEAEKRGKESLCGDA
jgi:hypothetical protein